MSFNALSMFLKKFLNKKTGQNGQDQRNGATTCWVVATIAPLMSVKRVRCCCYVVYVCGSRCGRVGCLVMSEAYGQGSSGSVIPPRTFFTIHCCIFVACRDYRPCRERLTAPHQLFCPAEGQAGCSRGECKRPCLSVMVLVYWLKGWEHAASAVWRG